MHPGFGAEFHYTIIRQRSFESKMLALAEDFSRLAELETALDWALARRPTVLINYLMTRILS